MKNKLKQWTKSLARGVILNRAGTPSTYWLTRTFFLRSLGFIYFFAFLSLVRQLEGLLSSKGLLPSFLYLQKLIHHYGGPWSSFFDQPSLFFINCSDPFLFFFAYLGLVLAALLMAGIMNIPSLFLLWLIHLSFCSIGQIFYGYGWEMLLLETGFLAMFLGPVLKPGLWKTECAPPKIIFILLRWLTFRIMFGAGLIKLRGDPCWHDLTCLIYHYETQPIPNPLSWFLHQLPAAFHYTGVLFNHFVELIVPFFLFLSRPLRYTGGIFIIFFQFILILSGNLSFLNYLTILISLSAFDDHILKFVVPEKLRQRVENRMEGKILHGRKWAIYIYTGVVVLLSIQPVLNLFSSEQAMNRSFDPFHLVNTYGAFGSVGKVRNEIILEGTTDSLISDSTVWRTYEFKYKPGTLSRRPPVIAPYQPRLDWQIWFAAMQTPAQNPWFIHLIYKLLQGDPIVSQLMDDNPFPEQAPRFIKADLFEYHFTLFKDRTKDWWTRKWAGPYLPPLSLQNPSLIDYLKRYGLI